MVYKVSDGLLTSETMPFHFFHVKSTVKAVLLEAVWVYWGISDEVILFELAVKNGFLEVEDGWMGWGITAEDIVFVLAIFDS